MNKMSKALKLNTYIPYVLMLGVLFLAYYPALTGYYLHTDDYFWSHWGNFSRNDVLKFMTIVGRPLSGFLYSCSVYIKKLAWMNLFRVLSVCNLCVAAFFLFHWFSFHKLNRWFSCILSITIFTLPSFQVYASYLSTAPFGIAVTLSILALLVVNRGLGEESRNSLWFYGIAIFVSMMAFALYQPSACFYLSLLSVPLLVDQESHFFVFLRKILIYSFIFVCSLTMYYLLWRLWLNWAAIPIVGKYDGRLFVTAFSTRWEWFMNGPFVEASNFWNINPLRVVSKLFTVLLGVVFLCSFIIRNKDNFLKISRSTKGIKLVGFDLLKYSSSILLIPISFFVVLISSSPSMEYRTYSALSTTLLLLLILPLVNLSKRINYQVLLNIFAISLMIVGLYYAYTTVKNYFVIPDSKEIRYIIKTIRDHQLNDNANFSGVAIVMINHPLSPRQRNEIGQPNTTHTPNIRPIVMTALNELSIEKSVRVFFCNQETIDSSWGEHGHVFQNGLGLSTIEISPQKNTIIVDMNKIDDSLNQ